MNSQHHRAITMRQCEVSFGYHRDLTVWYHSEWVVRSRVNWATRQKQLNEITVDKECLLSKRVWSAQACTLFYIFQFLSIHHDIAKSMLDHRREISRGCSVSTSCAGPLSASERWPVQHIVIRASFLLGSCMVATGFVATASPCRLSLTLVSTTYGMLVSKLCALWPMLCSKIKLPLRPICAPR